MPRTNVQPSSGRLYSQATRVYFGRTNSTTLFADPLLTSLLFLRDQTKGWLAALLDRKVARLNPINGFTPTCLKLQIRNLIKTKLAELNESSFSVFFFYMTIIFIDWFLTVIYFTDIYHYIISIISFKLNLCTFRYFHD